ncbi:unnamed protein product [Clavelina lepadiformis]|uniref:Uncharacterized protein n=1 Tax=Clavelina lepadiformis TaxID=159417 RepID=A0ABP0FQY2_CLALP
MSDADQLGPRYQSAVKEAQGRFTAPHRATLSTTPPVVDYMDNAGLDIRTIIDILAYRYFILFVTRLEEINTQNTISVLCRSGRSGSPGDIECDLWVTT